MVRSGNGVLLVGKSESVLIFFGLVVHIHPSLNLKSMNDKRTLIFVLLTDDFEQNFKQLTLINFAVMTLFFILIKSRFGLICRIRTR